ncbi:hypothetical protein [Paludibaculum fermentans]|uniref:Uncharacterized protein n=1 Tax=Paludibaculum fermentans TaxID=1473598 RepID=A0A7S7SGT3_PALFE|nr:hypothetical protein [Paludibaculum fermentans]QOY85177.1 hypothetical protein IRI77_20285 [Paludibaculum fermentans]
MLLPSAGSGQGLAPVVVGAGLIYAGVWMAVQPAGAWRLIQDFMEGIQRFSSALQGGHPWAVTSRGSAGNPPAATSLRLAGAVVALLGVVSLSGGLGQWA